MACCNTNVERKKWTNGATERINRLRDRFFQHKPELDVFRALIYTRVYKETEAEDLPIRHAKALLAYMSEKPLVIDRDELIIGTEGSKHRSAVVCPEICYKWIEDEMDTMATRPQDPYQISDLTKKILREIIFPFWEGKSMEEYFYANMSDELKNIGMGTNIVFSDAKSATGGGEWSVGYHNIVMKKGFRGVREEAEAHLAALDRTDPQTWDKAKFYEAVIISCEACRVMCQRHADYARKLAADETDPARKAELYKIAEACNAPYNPPRNFHEAVQAVWFTQTG